MSDILFGYYSVIAKVVGFEKKTDFMWKKKLLLPPKKIYWSWFHTDYHYLLVNTLPVLM